MPHVPFLIDTKGKTGICLKKPLQTDQKVKPVYVARELPTAPVLSDRQADEMLPTALAESVQNKTVRPYLYGITVFLC